MMLKRVWLSLIDFLYPKSAEVYALESLSPSELVLKLPSAENLDHNTIAIFAYHDERAREMIHELKYRQNRKIIQSFAVIAYDVLKSELADRILFDNFVNPILIPIPMSDKKRRERGFNQTEILCAEILKLDTEKFFEYMPKALAKSHTESQTLTKDRKTRLRNVEGSITASNVKGRNIIVLDDVTTTGATFRDARRALRESGAKKILCLALAH